MFIHYVAMDSRQRGRARLRDGVGVGGAAGGGLLPDLPGSG